MSRSESEVSIEVDDLLGARFARRRMLASARVQEMLRLASLRDLSGLRLPRRASYSGAKRLQFYGLDWYTGRRRGKGGSPRGHLPVGVIRIPGPAEASAALGLGCVVDDELRGAGCAPGRHAPARAGLSWHRAEESTGGGPLESMGPGVDQSKSCTS